MNTLLHLLDDNAGQIIDRSRKITERPDTKLALQNLHESLRRLEVKYEAYRYCVEKLRGLIDNNQTMDTEPGEATLAFTVERNEEGEDIVVEAGDIPSESHDLQFSVHSSVEDYHQHIYVVLSKIGQLIKHSSVKNFEKNLPPLRSNKKLLDSLRNINPNDAVFISAVDQLESSRRFRSEYVDHYQNINQSNWMTMDSGDNIYTIYYIPRSDAFIYRAPKHPLDPAFEPPYDFKSFIVSPPVMATHQALRYFLINVLDLRKDTMT